MDITRPETLVGINTAHDDVGAEYGVALLTACRGTLAWVDRDGGGVCDREDGGANGGDGQGGTFPEKAGANRRAIGWM